MKIGGVATILILAAPVAFAQEMPADYTSVLKTLGKQGDYKANVLKINIRRNDLKVSIDGIATPTPFGFGGWLAMTKSDGEMDVIMGDLVLVEDEVNPVMSALLENGFDVTALHNHFFFESPRIFYMHVHGHGKASDLARRLKPALDQIGHSSMQHQSTASGGQSDVSAGPMDTKRIASIVGRKGEQTGPVYKITIGRDDLAFDVLGIHTVHSSSVSHDPTPSWCPPGDGCDLSSNDPSPMPELNARMGLNTWAAFFGSDSNAEIAGDIAMLPQEITPVLRALRSNNLKVVAIHNHMTTGQPTIYFLHYWGTGSVEKLASGFKAALDELGKPADQKTAMTH